MKRILIVDDAIDLCRMFQEALRAAHPDIPVTVVPSGEEALLESTRLSFDLLITDIRLPGISGLDLIRKIRIRQPHIRVIVITGISLDERLKKQKDDLNPEVFMRKPIGVTEMLDAVDQLLEIGEVQELPDESVAADALSSNAASKEKDESPDAALLEELAAVFPGTPVPAHSKNTAPLKKGTGSLIPPKTPPPPTESGLSAILSRLRSSLGAQAAILVDERGHPVAQTGDLPALSLDNQLLSPLMAALSAGARLSFLLGQSSTQSVQAFRGANFDLVIAPVGQYALLLALKNGRGTLRLALAFEEALQAQVELLAALESMGLHVQSAVEIGAPETLLDEPGADGEASQMDVSPEILETPLGQDPSLEKFEELFARKQTGQLGLQDPDSFWDTAASGESTDINTPGVLTFEQAQKLGLFPPEQ